MTSQTNTIRRLDPAALRAKRAKRLAGETFVLEHTDDEPVEVRVRRPDIFDADVLLSFPTTMQEAIYNLIEQTQRLEGNATNRDEVASEIRDMPLDQVIKTYGSASRIARAYCIAGFIEPRCYATAEEADREGGIWVEDIAHADRMAFMTWCNNPTKEAAATVAETFPDEPAAGEWTGPAGTPVPGADVPGAHHHAPGDAGRGGDVPGGGATPHQ